MADGITETALQYILKDRIVYTAVKWILYLVRHLSGKL